MKLDEGQIKDLVNETERKRSNWVAWADEWERLWRLCDFDDNPKDHKDMDGVRSVVMPDPFNIIQLLQRMVADEMRVEVPSLSVKEDDEDRSEMLEEWLVAFDFESNRQQGRNHGNDKTWQSGVLGRGASRTIYTGDIMPKGMAKLPILRENLDPRNVGVSRTYFGTEWAYHKYKTTRSYIERRYPKFKLPEHDPSKIQGYWNDKFTVIDFWGWHESSVWHSVTIDDKFAFGPVKTDYPDVPIIEWYADGAPTDDEMGRSLSIIHPIRGPYQDKNDFISTMMTGLEYHYNPMIVTTNMSGQKLAFGPGSHVDITGDQKLDAFRPEPNVPMAQAVLNLLQTGIDQSTFPGVTYGDAPGGVNAGFALNNLAQQARARANIIRSNIEGAFEYENQLILGLIEALAPADGIEIYGRSTRSDRGRPLKLSKKLIKGNYANRVTLIPEQTTDDNAKIMAWLQMVDKGIVSKTLFRNRVLNVAMPRDEETRVAAEQALQMPEMQQKATLRALQKTRPQADWELAIVGTPLQQLHEAEQQWLEQKRQEEEQAKAQRAQEKEQKRLQELLEQGQAHMMPDGTIMEGAPMPPPPIPGMNSTGIPSPSAFSTMPPPTGAPSPMGPPPLPSDMSMQPQGLPGTPPAMSGQMTPDMLGLGPDAGAGQFQQMMGQPELSDEEMMKRMGGLPPQF